jgi:hypothetical protein
MDIDMDVFDEPRNAVPTHFALAMKEAKNTKAALTKARKRSATCDEP